MKQFKSIDLLANAIQEINNLFFSKVVRQVNIALTLRNWIIGYYIVEYEQGGDDRAVYGQRLYKVLVDRLKSKGLKSLGERSLYLCKDFYLAYPQILQSTSAKSYLTDFQIVEILQTASAKLTPQQNEISNTLPNDPNLLLERLSFSHFIELLKAESSLKRSFYEIQAIKNNWGYGNLKEQSIACYLKEPVSVVIRNRLLRITVKTQN